MNYKTLEEKLNKVPFEIKEWFGSEQIVYCITDINRRFSVTGEERERIIPKLLLRLEIHDLEPQYFSGELAAKLQLDKDKARVVSEEIRRTILRPIRKQLADYGIDISLLEKFEIPVPISHIQKEVKAQLTTKPTAAPEPVNLEETPAAAVKASEPPVPPPISESAVFKQIEEEKREIPPPPEPPAASGTKPFTASETKPPATRAAETPVKPDEPFILHKEEGLAPILETKRFAFEPPPAAPRQTKPPVAARLETAPEKSEEPRTVHYSELRTPLGGTEKAAPKDESVIDLSSFRKIRKDDENAVNL